MKNKLTIRIDKRIFYLDWLPTPIGYYQAQFPESIDTSREWLSVRCCFHEDKHPSLRINLITGAFHCFACAKAGGNIIAFHCQRYGLSFQEAVKSLEDW